MTNPSRTLLRQNLRKALAEAGMTQEALAREVGVSHRQVQKYCAGEAEPRGLRLVELAAALGKDAGWFYVDHTLTENAA